MLEGWYCRTLANQKAAAAGQQDDDENEQNADSGSEDSQEGTSNPNLLHHPVDYKEQYKYLKQKLKLLLYENEFFQDALRTSQRRLLKVSRDRSFLLDRLLQYEKPEITSSESEETESSDESSKVETKKRKLDSSQSGSKNNTTTAKKKKVVQQKPKPAQNTQAGSENNQSQSQSHQSQQQQQQQGQQQQQQQQAQEGHMTAEEVERHLQSKQLISELLPEKAPPTVPTEMFSNEPSLDSESNDQMVETSPSNVGEDCASIDMSVVKTEYIKTEYQT